MLENRISTLCTLFGGLILITISACSPPTPEQLAKESCDCFQKVKKQNNVDNQIESIEGCTGLIQLNKHRMREIEKDEDMNYEQVQAFEARFDTVYNQCK